MGIAPRRLWGWEPKSTTEYVYEGDVLIRSVTSIEAEFDGEQIAYLTAIHDYERNFGAHGHPMDEATSDGANPTNYESGWGYESLPHVIDWAEKKRLDAIDAWRAQGTSDAPMNMNGLIFPVVKRVYPKPN